jgi:hypothetical protein
MLLTELNLMTLPPWGDLGGWAATSTPAQYPQ